MALNTSLERLIAARDARRAAELRANELALAADAAEAAAAAAWKTIESLDEQFQRAVSDFRDNPE